MRLPPAQVGERSAGLDRAVIYVGVEPFGAVTGNICSIGWESVCLPVCVFSFSLLRFYQVFLSAPRVKLPVVFETFR